MNSSSTHRNRLSVRELVILSVLAAVTMGGKVLMSNLPNIEPVSLMLMCCALVFGAKALYTTVVYVGLEIAVFGLGTWTISYFYVWPLLVLLTLLLRRHRSYVVLTALSAAFGLFFGAMCSIPYFFIGGVHAAFAYWIAGIPYDVVHCIGNAVMAAAFLKPLHKLLSRLAGVELWQS